MTPSVIDLVGLKTYPTDKLFDLLQAVEKELETRNPKRLKCPQCDSVLD